MKTTMTLIISAMLICANAFGNDGKFMEAMQKNIQTIYAARDIAAYQESINAFERIAGTEKNRWEPFYYIGFGYIMMGNVETDVARKDLFLDKALEAVEKGKAISGSESELLALEGFAYMLKVGIDPQSRGMVYAPRASQVLDQAMKLNPENPRAMALLAQMQFGTAKFFGSPTADACALNARAIEKFATYKSENPLAPVWGLQMAQSMIAACK